MTYPRSHDVARNDQTALGDDAPTTGADATTHGNDGAPATVAGTLRLGGGFAAAERPDILERLSSLDHALAAFPADVVELELSMKDRDRPGQSTTLQCWVAGSHRLVATSSRPAFVSSLVEVRDDLRRQLDDAKSRSTPRHDPPGA